MPWVEDYLKQIGALQAQRDAQARAAFLAAEQQARPLQRDANIHQSTPFAYASPGATGYKGPAGEQYPYPALLPDRQEPGLAQPPPLLDPVDFLAGVLAPKGLQMLSLLGKNLTEPRPLRLGQVGQIGQKSILNSQRGSLGGAKDLFPRGEIRSLEDLRTVVRQSTDESPLYLRWSRGPSKDLARPQSRDYVSGQSHKGLSAVDVNPEWSTDDGWLARRIMEYRFLRMKDPKIRAWIYKGKTVGTDSDRYPLITDIIPVGKISQAVLKQLDKINYPGE